MLTYSKLNIDYLLLESASTDQVNGIVDDDIPNSFDTTLAMIGETSLEIINIINDLLTQESILSELSDSEMNIASSDNNELSDHLDWNWFFISCWLSFVC